VEGLSVRSVFVNCFFQTVIFLYLWEFDTSWMIIVQTGIGCLIEFWKVTRAADVSYGLKGNRFFNGPWIRIEDKKEYLESETAKYDRQAMQYLSYALYPLLVGYTIYSLVYNEHKSWYAFVLSTLVSFIHVFGFIMMCPQLYLNYKLRSVAHLPWRMLTYKFLNTIIDDLFAFLITMPMLHRLSCFRDDVIFVIFLYQKWKYPTDYSRANEYGFIPKTQEEVENENKEQPAVEDQAAEVVEEGKSKPAESSLLSEGLKKRKVQQQGSDDKTTVQDASKGKEVEKDESANPEPEATKKDK